MLLIFMAFLYAQAAMPHYYHTTEQINQAVDEILADCNGAHKEDHSDGLYTIHYGGRNAASVIIFGEHARELITVETGLHFLKQICKHQRNHNLIMVLNMNPMSRKHVEKGHFCLRESVTGVDLNRNYDVNWQHAVDHQNQVSSGDKPFSESATQLVQELLNQYKPKTFISVHSGAKALLTPYAYRMHAVAGLEEPLIPIRRKHCPSCLLGGAAREIGYTANGCSMDYAYEVAKVPRSYTLEIFKQQQAPRVEPESTFAEFLQNRVKSEITAADWDCFHYFNPKNEQEYWHHVKMWSNILIEMIQ